MHASLVKRAAVLTALAMPLLFAGPASATQPAALGSVAGRFRSGSETQRAQDGTCPRKRLDGDPSYPRTEEFHQVFRAKIANHQHESVVVSVCWQNSSALGGDGVERGDFSLVNDSGSLSGSVGGTTEFSHNSFDLTLTIEHATGGLSGASGTLRFFGCPTNSGLVGKLRVRPLAGSPPYPAACAQ
jgi:hypothetical protein